MYLSLRFKFIFVFLVFTVTLSSVFGVVTTQRLSSELAEQEQRHALHFAKHAAEEVLESLLFETGHDVDLLARNLMTKDNVFVQIVIDNVIRAEQSAGRIYPDVLPQPVAAYIKKVDRTDSGPYLDVVQPLDEALDILATFGHVVSSEGKEILNSGVHGYVRLGWSLQAMNQSVFNESLLLTGLSLTFVVLGLLLGWVLYRTILGPLETLSTAMCEFGAGNTYTRARIKSGDEIEMLGYEFDTMASAIVTQRNDLKDTNKKLAMANDVKSTFLATVSHELRTPLHSILGYVSLLLDGVNVKLSKAGLQYAHAIQRGGKHLLALIENMIEFSKLESGTEQLQFSSVSVEDIVNEVIESERPLSEKKGLLISTDIDPQLIVYADKTKLKQVLINLMDNAIKYTQKGQVRVSARRNDALVCIEVADTGPGIAPEIQSSLFDPFVRADKGKNDGMGLGLTVVKRYIERMHGTLEFESIPEKGSRFWFTLPLEDPDETVGR